MKSPGDLFVSETEHWLVSHRDDSALPGYLIVSAKKSVSELCLLSEAALVELGPLLSKMQKTLRDVLHPMRVYIGRYGHSPGYPIHFHLIPIYDWVEQQFWNDTRYRIFENFRNANSGDGADGAELTLFVWREFCERPDPPDIQGCSVFEAIQLLRVAAGSVPDH